MMNFFVVVLFVAPLSKGQRSACSRCSSSSALTIPWRNTFPTTTDKYSRILYGEDKNHCEGTKVTIDIQDADEDVNFESIEMAVEKAVQENARKQDILEAAQETAFAILDTLAQFVGQVKVTIDSKKKGCWGIGFGRTWAQAYAETTTTALAEQLSNVTGRPFDIELDALTNDYENNASAIIESIAAIYGHGSGGKKSMKRDILTQAKVDRLSCGIAKAYAVSNGLYGDDTYLSSLCQSPVQIMVKGADQVSCRCRNFGDQPLGCGQYGQNGSYDYICYVANPNNCPCSQNSKIYPGLKWRFCGQTLAEMQIWLNIRDDDNDIFWTVSEYGYCGTINSRID